jgi:protein-S-isoprenylcysteine O-methyltransferase Ste14
VRAAIGSLVFLVLVPGVVAGLLPWALTGWQSRSPGFTIQVLGVILLAGGAIVLINAFGRFVVEGVGTPAPIAPTQRLVVGGLYRHVRNPMYLAVACTIIGQALVLGRPSLLVYAAIFGVAVIAFVHAYEEPTLAKRYGDQYEAYRHAVPAWRPRLRRGISLDEPWATTARRLAPPLVHAHVTASRQRFPLATVSERDE